VIQNVYKYILQVVSLSLVSSKHSYHEVSQALYRLVMIDIIS